MYYGGLYHLLRVYRKPRCFSPQAPVFPPPHHRFGRKGWQLWFTPGGNCFYGGKKVPPLLYDFPWGKLFPVDSPREFCQIFCSTRLIVLSCDRCILLPIKSAGSSWLRLTKIFVRRHLYEEGVFTVSWQAVCMYALVYLRPRPSRLYRDSLDRRCKKSLATVVLLLCLCLVLLHPGDCPPG